jgi:hypothetical protein
VYIYLGEEFHVAKHWVEKGWLMVVVEEEWLMVVVVDSGGGWCEGEVGFVLLAFSYVLLTPAILSLYCINKNYLSVYRGL